MMKRKNKLAAIAFFNIVILLLLVEVAGIGVFFADDGELFYQRSSPPAMEPATAEATAGTRFVLHPIMGFVRRPGMPLAELVSRSQLDALLGPGPMPPWQNWTTNNFGFFSPRDYPYTPEAGRYLVGVFGGSVAQWFALQGAETLVRRLRQDPSFESREVEIVNFAQGAFKQPQQLQALAYFLARGQSLDFVLNIDGFNDVALSLLNIEDRIDPSLPSSRQMLPLIRLLDQTAIDLELIELHAQARRAREQLLVIDTRMQSARSAGAWLILKFRREWMHRRYDSASRQLADVVGFAGNKLVYLNAWPGSQGLDPSLELIASTWMRASILMNSMLRAKNIPYLHVIQPNQYFSKKPFTDQERRAAINASSPFADGAARGYPFLLAQLPAMRAEGVDAISAVELFDETATATYADNCCHLTQAGNEELARFVASHIIRAASEQQRDD